MHDAATRIGTAPSEMATEPRANTSPGKSGRPDEGRGNLVGPTQDRSGIGEVHDHVPVTGQVVADLAHAAPLDKATIGVVDAPRGAGELRRVSDPLIDRHTHILPNRISTIWLHEGVCRDFGDKSPAQTFDLTRIWRG